MSRPQKKLHHQEMQTWRRYLEKWDLLPQRFSRCSWTKTFLQTAAGLEMSRIELCKEGPFLKCRDPEKAISVTSGK